MNPAVSRHGHAYVCRICLAEGSSVVDRKGRMISHIMKQHIPLDEVPFYCSLCLFRATDRKSLMAHVQNYSRHVKLARDLGITTDHSIYLHASSKPAKIGDTHMIVLSPEVEMRRPRQLTTVEDPLDSWEDLQSWGESTSSTPMLPGTMNTRRVLSSLQSPRGVSTAASASPLEPYTATKIGGNLGYGPADYTIPPVVPVTNISAQDFATISTMPAMLRRTQESATGSTMPAMFRHTQDSGTIAAMPAFRSTQDSATGMPAFRSTQDSATGMPAFRPTQDAATVGAMPAVLLPTGVAQVSTVVHQEPTLILQSGPVLQSAVLTTTSSSAPVPAVSTLAVFRKQYPPTPLQDETASFLDLITRADDQDPLMKELRGGTPQALMKRAASGVANDSEGCAKKPRAENQGATGKKTEQSEERGATDKVESQELASILKAIERSNARVVEAMEKNTRAVKDEERMMGRVLTEVAHVSRVLDRWEKKDENKENRPSVKSIVTSVTGKKH